MFDLSERQIFVVAIKFTPVPGIAVMADRAQSFKVVANVYNRALRNRHRCLSRKLRVNRNWNTRSISAASVLERIVGDV